MRGRVDEAVLDLVRDEAGQVGASGLAEGVRGHQLEGLGGGSSVRNDNVLKREVLLEHGHSDLTC